MKLLHKIRDPRLVTDRSAIKKWKEFLSACADPSVEAILK